MDVADVKVICTVCGNNDIDPTPDDNGKDNEHVADQKATEEVTLECSIESDGLDVDPKESAEEDVRSATSDLQDGAEFEPAASADMRENS